ESSGWAKCCESLFKLGENFIGFLQRLFRADVIPKSRHAPRVKWRARIQPLHKPARLVGIVAFGDVLLDEWNRGFWIKIKPNARERARWIFWFFLEKGDAPVAVSGNGVVFFYL